MPLEVTTLSGHRLERATGDHLIDLCRKYDLRKWEYTDWAQARIGVISHSHPILTIAAGDYTDDALLATYLHEQMHWFSLTKGEEWRAAQAELRSRYPEVPGRDGGAAADEFSTYLHLLVCPLELLSASEVVGWPTVEEIGRGYRHYRWIYDEFLADRDYFASLLKRYGLMPGDAPSPPPRGARVRGFRSRAEVEDWITIDSRPLLGPAGEASAMPCPAFANAGQFATAVYYMLEPAVPPFSYGSHWVLRDLSGADLASLGGRWARSQGLPADSRSLMEAGILPGMRLEAHRVT